MVVGIQTKNESRIEHSPKLGCRFLWICTELILAGSAVLNEEYEQNDRADNRNQCEKQPPAATVGVVKASDPNGNTRDENRQAIEGPQGTRTACKSFDEQELQKIMP